AELVLLRRIEGHFRVSEPAELGSEPRFALHLLHEARIPPMRAPRQPLEERSPGARLREDPRRRPRGPRPDPPRLDEKDVRPTARQRPREGKPHDPAADNGERAFPHFRLPPSDFPVTSPAYIPAGR